MRCPSFLDALLDETGDKPPKLLIRLGMALHMLRCSSCAGKITRFTAAREILSRDFLPPIPSHLEGVIMDRIYAEPESIPADMDFGPGVPFRSWVITGFIVLLSLTTAFFGIDFIHVAASLGSSFLIPVGITIGSIITGYGALFIGSHLKEFSERFGLH